jgi:hypothetical protein
MRVWNVVLLAIIVGTGVPVALHHQMHGLLRSLHG